MRLAIAGLIFLVIVATVITLLIAKSRGALDRFVRVSAELVNVGDGLPAKSDVKFRGVLVGFVSGVIPAEIGRPNIVRINLKPQYASGIPITVTARVVPSNVFAVSSVQLVDNGKHSPGLRAGSVIHEDQTLPTVLFQTTLDKFRQVLKAIGREPTADSIGWLTAFGEATNGRGDRLEHAGRDLHEMVTQLNTIVTGDTGPSTLSAITAATAGLRDTAPELLDALDKAVRPMRTIVEKQAQLTAFLSGGLRTVGTLGDSFDHHTDRLIGITTQLTPVIGVLADSTDAIRQMGDNVQMVVAKVMDGAWNYDTNQLQAKGIIALTPTRTYVRADCPHYGELRGPSCDTAPEIPTAPALTPSLGSMGYPLPPGSNENRPNYAPPRGSVLPPEAYAPPAPPPPAPSPAEAPPPPAAPPGAVPQSATIGGTVGPVGSRQETDQLSAIIGAKANAATEALLAPLVRGTTVRIEKASGGGR